MTWCLALRRVTRNGSGGIGVGMTLQRLRTVPTIMCWKSRARLSIYSDHGRIAMVHPRWQSFLYRRWGLPVRRSSHSFPSTKKSMCSRLEAKGHHESIHVFLDSKKEVGVPFSSENIQHGIEWFVLPSSLSTSTSGRTPTTKTATGPIILLDRQNDLFGISDLLFKMD